MVPRWRIPPLDRWKVRKDGGDFDQLTGATITPRAVVQAVRNALLYYRQHQETLFATGEQVSCYRKYKTMNDPTYTQILKDGLWSNNPGLVQLLGLCPLLAVTTTAINGLGMGLATLMTLVFSNLIVSLIRKLVRPEVRIPVFVLVIASVVTMIELAMNAWLHELYKILGIFIPLIVTNCAIIGRAESFASRHSADRALLDAVAMGIGFTLVLVALGGMRELIGQGTLLSQAHLMFGEIGRWPDAPP